MSKHFREPEGVEGLADFLATQEGLEEGILTYSDGQSIHLGPPQDFWQLTDLETARAHGKAVHASGMFLIDDGVIDSQMYRALRPETPTPNGVDDFEIVTEEKSFSVQDCLPPDGWRRCPVWMQPDQLDRMALNLFNKGACEEEPPDAVGESRSHPIYVDWVGFGARGGALGITLAPGLRVLGRWKRDLANDLERVGNYVGVTRLVSALSEPERHSLGVGTASALADTVARIRWFASEGLTIEHVPLEMYAAPSRRELWSFVMRVQEALDAGQWVAIHSRSGLGRAALLAACCLVGCKLVRSREEAVDRIRSARPGSFYLRAHADALLSFVGEAKPVPEVRAALGPQPGGLNSRNAPGHYRSTLEQALAYGHALHHDGAFRVVTRPEDGMAVVEALHVDSGASPWEIWWYRPGADDDIPTNGWGLTDDEAPGLRER